MGGRSHGFTLLELLVVLVMVGIIISFAVLSIGDGGQGRRITQEAERLVALIEHAGDEAMIQGVELGLHFTENDYQFITLKKGRWVSYQEKESFRQRQLPEGSHLELSLDTLPVSLPAEHQGEQVDRVDKKRVEPQILILSSGERSPFEITLFNGEQPAIRIDGDMIGAVRWQRVEQQ